MKYFAIYMIMSCLELFFWLGWSQMIEKQSRGAQPMAWMKAQLMPPYVGQTLINTWMWEWEVKVVYCRSRRRGGCMQPLATWDLTSFILFPPLLPLYSAHAVLSSFLNSSALQHALLSVPSVPWGLGKGGYWFLHSLLSCFKERFGEAY